jgi:hypothetical protein
VEAAERRSVKEQKAAAAVEAGTSILWSRDRPDLAEEAPRRPAVTRAAAMAATEVTSLWRRSDRVS